MGNHRENDCEVPFCSECWKVIKGNLMGIKRVADELRNSVKAPSEHKASKRASSRKGR